MSVFFNLFLYIKAHDLNTVTNEGTWLFVFAVGTVLKTHPLYILILSFIIVILNTPSQAHMQFNQRMIFPS